MGCGPSMRPFVYRFVRRLVAVVSVSVAMLLVVAVGVAASVAWAVVITAVSPVAGTVAPAAILADPTSGTPCCSVVGRHRPVAGGPGVAATDGSPVAWRPYVADGRHGWR